MKKKLPFAFDLDDVLVHLRPLIQYALDSATEKHIPWQQWGDYDLGVVYGISHHECLDAFRLHRVIERALPEPGAVSVTRALSAMGYRIEVVTARGWHPEGEAATVAFLDAHGFAYDKLHVVPLGVPKTSAYLSIGDIEAVIDDSPTHIRAAATLPNVKNTFVVDRPWNRAMEPHGAIRISEVTDLLPLYDITTYD